MLLLPTLGPLHLLHPRYNAQTVVELVKAQQPSSLLLASYGTAELEKASWRDEGELSLFHLLPWAESNQIAVMALDDHFALKSEAEQFRQVMAQVPKGQQMLGQLNRLEAGLQTLLTQPLTPDDFSRPEFMQGLRDYLDGVVGLFGEGPATGYRLQRMQGVAQGIAGVAGRGQPGQGGRGAGEKKIRQGDKERGGQGDKGTGIVVLVDVLDYLTLKSLLPITHHPSALRQSPVTPSDAERQRAILDRAWRLEPSDDWALLLNQLQEVDGPEAMYLASQIYLAAGQTEDAFTLLEQLVHTDFQHPAYLPGYVLARYGQLADSLGQREKALRAYRAVLALSWAPAEAKEIALAGQLNPFQVGASHP